MDRPRGAKVRQQMVFCQTASPPPVRSSPVASQNLIRADS